jgi:hypothetical protein
MVKDICLFYGGLCYGEVFNTRGFIVQNLVKDKV